MSRFKDIPGFSIDRVAAEAGSDPDVLRLENLDTDLRPPAAAIEATKNALTTDDANSYLPFTGQMPLRHAIAKHIKHYSGHAFNADREIVVTCGGTEGTFDAFLALTELGDEVIVTDPAYAGTIYRLKIAGAVPKFAPLEPTPSGWRLDIEALRNAVTPKTRALCLQSPSMPSGAVFSRAEWDAIAEVCAQNDLWLVYISAFERILYDNRELLHPLKWPELKDRTIVIGSMSKEFRMIGWRIGWVAAPERISGQIAQAHIYNVVTPPGVTQAGAAAAFGEDPSELSKCVAEWQKRRDTIMSELKAYPLIPAHGGWSMLLDVKAMGFGSFEASARLLEKGRVAATPMRDWGQKHGDRWVRLVFSNETPERLSSLGERFKKSF